MIEPTLAEKNKPTSHSPWLGNLKKHIYHSLKFWGGFAVLSGQVFKELLTSPFYFKLLIEQLYRLGVQSLFLVAVTALATGSVMALQFGLGLAKFGGTLYVPKIVSLAILREMGPVFTSLLVAGRVGSGIAAEVASMKITQQIDAIRALGTSPIKRIVIPRVLALLIGLPILTILANYIALLGAMWVSHAELNIGVEFFTSKIMETVVMKDVYVGLIKVVVFAYFIGIAACWKGLNSDAGTEGVGAATTWVVVSSSVFIMISDFFLTKLTFALIYGIHGT